MNCSLHDTGANKQMIIYCILMVHTFSGCQMSANSCGNSSNSSKWFHLIQNTTTHCFICCRAWQNLAQKNSAIIQASICHQTSHLCNYCIRLRGLNDDSPPPLPTTLPTINEQLPFTHSNDAKQHGESMANVVEPLPEPDDKAIAIMENPQVELLHWHYRLNQVSFWFLKTFECKGAQVCSIHL